MIEGFLNNIWTVLTSFGAVIVFLIVVVLILLFKVMRIISPLKIHKIKKENKAIKARLDALEGENNNLRTANKRLEKKAYKITEPYNGKNV